MLANLAANGALGRVGLCAVTTWDPHSEGRIQCAGSESKGVGLVQGYSRQPSEATTKQRSPPRCRRCSHRTPATDVVQSGHQEAFMYTIHEQDRDLAAVLLFCALGLALSLTVLSMLPADAMSWAIAHLEVTAGL